MPEGKGDSGGGDKKYQRKDELLEKKRIQSSGSRGVKRRTEGCNERALRPEYLNKTGKTDNQKLVARIRCGNLEEGNRYWVKEEDRKCGLCKLEKETLKHLIEDWQELERGELKEETLVEGRADERVYSRVGEED
ncbi:uncharacterized protein LOC128890435 [Hylaeus anthracinus]|uniref:uncharacterized protein LOC128890435 n=1 Tax=Hylaeus anthracinus TaxID=313031 RepID=UPI0023B9C5A4|nr:uncharacterized protein LOC128890435 [Hylaeus anthracinus]